MSWWQMCIVMIIGTVCLTVFMMLTASNPSADDFWRGIGGGIVALGAGGGLMKMLGK
jgi:hypothetical protein